MTDLIVTLAWLSVGLPVAAALLTQVAPRARSTDRVGLTGAVGTAGAAGTLATLALVRSGEPVVSGVVLVDTASGVFLAVIAAVGLLSALVSPAYLDGKERGFFAPARARHWYWLGFHLFWAALLAVPIAANLGVAWLLVEATTAASALLVAYSGRRNALEAGWKYLVLTTIGLTVALLGIVVAYASAPGAEGLSALGWGALERSAAGMPHDAAVVSFVLLLAGLATKIGWAPVHNWLPDAHSEAPPPVSALLSAALLPAVALVAWRSKIALEPAVGGGTTRAVFLGFGLASLAVAVPFLWRPLAWKRLLAYSSLEHMGVIALGIGFGHPLAIAGVILHVAGHALAKALGFYAAIPLLQFQPQAALRSARGVARTSPATASAMGISLGSLSGLPPSPLFFSELFVLLGGFLSGHGAVAAVAAVLLSLGFLGLVHALIESMLGEPRGARAPEKRSSRLAARLTLVVGIALLALSVTAIALPDSAPVEALVRWAG